MRFLFIHSHARIFHITTMCRVLKVSRAGYYAWRARPLAERVKADRRLRARIRVIYEEAKGRYGSPRVYQELRALGLPCGKHRTARLMRGEGLRAKSARRFRVTTQSAHAHPPAPNALARDFAVAERRRLRPRPRRPCGWPTSRTCRRGKAGSISRSFLSAPRGAWWAGRSARIWARSSPGARWRWRSRSTGPRVALCITPIGACSTPRTPIAGGSGTRASP